MYRSLYVEWAEVIAVVPLIDRSSVMVRDCTNRDPNVFCEMGIAQTRGRGIIPITQNEADTPFDIPNIRNIRLSARLGGHRVL